MLDKMNKFLEKRKLLKLTQEEIENLKTPILILKLECAVENFSYRWFHQKFYQTCKEEIIPIVHKLFQRMEEEIISQFLIFLSSPTLIPKPGKDITRKENHRPISFMNIDINILNKILAN